MTPTAPPAGGSPARRWCCGHHMAEDAPDQLAAELTTFLDPALVTP